MDEPSKTRSYFIGYDIFGYLLPGIVLLGGLVEGNSWCHDYVVKGLYPHTLAQVVGSAKASLAVQVTAVLVVCYVTGHIIAAVSSLVIERAFLARIMGYPTKQMFPADRSYHSNKLIKLLQECGEWICKVPWLLFPWYYRPYSKSFIHEFRSEFRTIFHVEPEDNNDVFWLVLSYISLHHQPAYQRATHFLNLYGFARNTSLSFMLVAVIPFFSGWSHLLPEMTWLCIFIVCAFALFYNYAKLLRRLNDEIFRGFLVAARTSRSESLNGGQT